MAGQSDDLGAFLQDRLCAHTDLPVFVHILTDYAQGKESSDDTYSHLNWKHERLYRKRLILVFQRHKNSNLLVIGMSVHEYCGKGSSKVASAATSTSDERAKSMGEITKAYIQYVDTTGLFSPRQHQSHLTRTLVTSYIHYCHEQLHCQSIHLMASAKPSFLFAGSEYNKSKGRLSTAKLVKWWFAIIEQSCESIPCKVKVWSPGEDLVEDDRTAERIERRQAKQQHAIQWSYGPFYEPNDRICDVVPLLEDDPKLKHFMSFFEDVQNDTQRMDSLRCKNFTETLGLRPEFRNQCHSTLFMIELTQQPAIPKTIAEWPEKTTQLAAFAAKMLSNLTFEDEQKCLDASGKITSWLKFMGSKPVAIRIAVPDAPKHTMDAPSTDTPPVDIENVAVNVQGLVKKRRSEVC